MRRSSCTRRTSIEKAGVVPAFNADKEPEEWGVILDTLRRELTAHPGVWTQDRQGHSRRLGRDDDRRASPLRDDEGRHAAVPGDQRQRLGHQEQVRQHLRLPPLAARRSRPRHRRDARRQDRGRLRLRRSGQGLRAVAQGPGLPRRRHRDRSDLRAAGGDGRLRGRHDRRRHRQGRHLHHGDGQLQHHHRRSHEADEAQRDRRQHRPLRQRDRHGRAQEVPRHQEDQHQAAVRRVGVPGRPLGAGAGGRPSAQSRAARPAIRAS